MKKLSKNWKKAVAVVLSLAMTAGCLPTVGNYVKAAEQSSVEFDDQNIVLRMGVMSDLHLAYGYTSKDGIRDNVKSYAKAVGTLNAMADNKLDVLMLAGDYTGYGCEIQGKTFASASKAILDLINAGKSDAEKTQFFMTYGNHDTEWPGQMSYVGWESMLNSYNLLDGVTMGPDNSGCYKYTKKVNGKTYYFYSLETERYYADGVTNTFRTDVLEWLDTELAKTPKDAYTYVVSHGPISESGVYGADIDFERNANWGTSKDGFTGTVERDGQTYTTSSDLNGILEKYPQVLYLSGHTHMTNVLESTIMSDAYTAITVAQFKSAELYSSKTNYLDEAKNATRPGYSLYIEVDKDGNQKITRVDTESSTVIGDVTITGTEDTADNPTTGEDLKKFPTIYGYYTESVSMTKNESGKVEKLPAWTMMAPNSEGTHLATYSASARKETPVFNDGKLELNDVQNDKGKSVTVNFTFPTAKCTNSKVIRYEFTLYDETGRTLDTQWIIGNWINNTDGVTEDGKTHIDATTLTYSKKYENGELTGATGIYATLTAVNEFGGTTTLTAGSKDKTTSIGILKPTAVEANKNMFDGFTAEQVQCTEQKDVTTTLDEKGNATTVVNATANREIIYNMASQNRICSDWGNVTNNGRISTNIDVEQTFVYQTDFSIESNTGFYFTFRTTEAQDNLWKCDYSGIYIDQHGVSLKLNDVTLQWSDDFKSTDTETHTLLILSAPKSVSVWIDDILVFNNVAYDVTQEQEFTAPNTHNGITLKNTDMVPVIGFYITANGTKFTVSNQYLYIYNQSEQVADDWKATEANSYEADKVTSYGNITIENKTKNSLTVDATRTDNDWGGNRIEQPLPTDFDVTDTIVTEFDYTPTEIAEFGTDGWENISGIYVNFRTSEKENGTVRLLIRANNEQKLVHVMDGKEQRMSKYSGSAVVDNKTVHVKIVHDNVQAIVYLDGNEMGVYNYENLVNDATSVDSASMKPIFNIGLNHAKFKIDNIEIRKADGSEVLENVTKATDDNNLLNGVAGEITSSFTGNQDWEGKSDSVVQGNNFYTDLTWKNLQSNGATNFYMGELFYPFGATNANMIFKGNESFVASVLVSVKNKTLEKYSSRVGMQVADYGEKSLWYFIQDETLNVYQTVNGSNELLKALNLSTLIGYQVGDYIRMTTTMSPYGFDIYINGTKLFTFANGNGANVNFKKMAWSANGAEIRFLDASVHYNYDNEELYKEKLLAYASDIQGVYFENVDGMNVTISEMKEACQKATNSKVLWNYVGTVEKMISKSGHVVNNMLQDQTTAVTKTEVKYANGQYSWKDVRLFGDGKVPFGNADTWVIEADVTTIGFFNETPRIGIRFTENGYIQMLQISNIYMQKDDAGNYDHIQHIQGCDLYNNGKGSSLHVKYEIVKNTTMNVTLTSVDGTTQYYTGSVEMSKFNVTGALDPRLICANADVVFSNIYVGYDLAENVKAFDEAVTAGESNDLSSYAWESVELYKDALAQAKTVNEEVKAYVGDATANIYTTPYSKQEMETKLTHLKDMENSLKEATAFAIVGTDGIGSGKIQVGIADDKKLPVKEYISDKYYIIGWTCEGESVTEVTDITDMSKYVPEYVDLDMLQVKKQAKSNDKNSSWIDIRFIASVDKLDYKKAGLVFSVYDANPTIGKTDCLNKTKSTVYNSLYAEGGSETAGEVYTNNYSKYLFAHEYTGFAEGAVVYARAYVELSDGTIVYGAVRAVTAELSEN